MMDLYVKEWLDLYTKEWLNWAIDSILHGDATKLQRENITVYRCGTTVHIDIKGVSDGVR